MKSDKSIVLDNSVDGYSIVRTRCGNWWTQLRSQSRQRAAAVTVDLYIDSRLSRDCRS